tara:strand:- start:230 stop:430 length:201 start_codon:yes stop_codon:yes gene_type:complete
MPNALVLSRIFFLNNKELADLAASSKKIEELIGDDLKDYAAEVLDGITFIGKAADKYLLDKVVKND